MGFFLSIISEDWRTVKTEVFHMEIRLIEKDNSVVFLLILSSWI